MGGVGGREKESKDGKAGVRHGRGHTDSSERTGAGEVWGGGVGVCVLGEKGKVDLQAILPAPLTSRSSMVTSSIDCLGVNVGVQTRNEKKSLPKPPDRE